MQKLTRRSTDWNRQCELYVHRTALATFIGAVACASTLSRSTANDEIIDQGDQPVRIALATSASSATLGGTGTWRIYSRTTTEMVARGSAGETMRVEARGGQLVVVKPDGSVT